MCTLWQKTTATDSSRYSNWWKFQTFWSNWFLEEGKPGLSIVWLAGFIPQKGKHITQLKIFRWQALSCRLVIDDLIVKQLICSLPGVVTIPPGTKEVKSTFILISIIKLVCLLSCVPLLEATPVLLPRKSHGRRSLVGCSPWGRKESDTTEWLYFHFSLSCIGEGNGNPLQCSCLENPRDGGALWADVYGVAHSRTQLKRLSSSMTSFTYLIWISLHKQ